MRAILIFLFTVLLIGGCGHSCESIISKALIQEDNAALKDDLEDNYPFQVGVPLDKQLASIASISKEVRVLVASADIIVRARALSSPELERFNLHEQDRERAIYEIIGGCLHVRRKSFDDALLTQAQIIPTMNAVVLERGSVSIVRPDLHKAWFLFLKAGYSGKRFMESIERGFMRFTRSTGITVEFRSPNATGDYTIELVKGEDPENLGFARFDANGNSTFETHPHIGPYNKIQYGSLCLPIWDHLEDIIKRFEGTDLEIQRQMILTYMELVVEHELKHAIAFTGNIHHMFELGHSWDRRSRMFPSVALNYHVELASTLTPMMIPLITCGTNAVVIDIPSLPEDDPSGMAIRLLRAVLASNS